MKNLKKYANKFKENKKFNIIIKTKLNFKKLILKTYLPPKWEFCKSNLRSNSGFTDL